LQRERVTERRRGRDVRKETEETGVYELIKEREEGVVVMQLYKIETIERKSIVSFSRRRRLGKMMKEAYE
jgi:hypothetical protein